MHTRAVTSHLTYQNFHVAWSIHQDPNCCRKKESAITEVITLIGLQKVTL